MTDETLDPARVVAAALRAIEGTSIAGLEVEWHGGSLRVEREPIVYEEVVGLAPAFDDEPRGPVYVTSTSVGIFLRDPAADLPGVGDRVEASALLAHVETLGIPYAVVAPTAGVVREILVADRTPVEYGQRLLAIDPAPGPPQ